MAESTNHQVNNKPYSVIIEGNIGSGKSTLIKYFQSVFNNSDTGKGALILEEPVDKWVNHNGINLLVSINVSFKYK